MARLENTMSSQQPGYRGSKDPLTGLPQKQGLYDPQYERDACGVGFVVDLKNRKSHDIVRKVVVAFHHIAATAGESAGTVPDRGGRLF